MWAHICGSDLVRDADGTIYVLEDNLRVPSGVSYMLENRQITKRVFADLFRDLDIHPVDSYPNRLHDLLAVALAPRRATRPVIVVLTPGIYNSAYFEHAFLAQQMGAHLVEGSDLVVDDDDCVHMRTIDGPVRVDVDLPAGRRPVPRPRGLPRRTPRSACPGSCGRGGPATSPSPTRPAPASPTTRSSTPTCPSIIRYYLGEEPMIANVPTYLCHDDAQRSHVLANLDDLVVKPANESGGYGVFVGSAATAAEKDEVRRRVSRPTPATTSRSRSSQLSTAPTLCDGELAPRHLDLRPFILSGDRPYVTQGGLTRVALREGSLVVNSSQGGGSKDTWIVDPTVRPPSRGSPRASRTAQS